VTAPALAFLWGDDDLRAERTVTAFAQALEADTGMPLECWSIRGSDALPAVLVARLTERLATPVLFGGGTLAVVTGVGPLVKKAEDRDALLGAMATLAPGNALVIVESTKSGLKAPPHRPVVDAVRAHGGVVQEFKGLRAGALTAWIEAEARARALRLGAGAARELAGRIGAFVQEVDADRGHQTRLAAMELDKLALYRPEGPVTADDVRALAPEAIPSSIFALTDAVGMRRTRQAIELLERHLDEGRPEPVLIAMLHRRLRELIEAADRMARGETAASLVRSMNLVPFRAEKVAEQARMWSVGELTELTEALEGLIDLDASLRGEPGSGVGDAQHRMAFGLWIVERLTRA
jgi:DNA polymerase III delta subunit